jgi:hypothetical protein
VRLEETATSRLKKTPEARWSDFIMYPCVEWRRDELMQAKVYENPVQASSRQGASARKAWGDEVASVDKTAEPPGVLDQSLEATGAKTTTDQPVIGGRVLATAPHSGQRSGVARRSYPQRSQVLFNGAARRARIRVPSQASGRAAVAATR